MNSQKKVWLEKEDHKKLKLISVLEDTNLTCLVSKLIDSYIEINNISLPENDKKNNKQ